MSSDKLQFLSPIFLKYQSDFEKNPRSRVFAPLAESYRKVGMLDKAMDILSQGIRFNPTYTMGYVGLAFCYYDLRQYNLAYSTLRPLVEGNRDNIRLQKLFADVCLSLLKEDEALETFKYLLFINPKDKEIADFVTKLERKLEEKYRPVHKPIIIPEESFMDNEGEKNKNIFEIDKLDSAPTVDFDDWLHVDLNSKETSSKTEDSLGWNVKNISNTREVESTNNNRISISEINDQSIEDLPSDESSSPIVTHTLVDLYCGQGHIEKALEVLEKILILNPNDQKTKDKINEIKSLAAPSEDDLDLKDEDLIDSSDESSRFLEEVYSISSTHLSQNNLVNLDDLENVSEEDGRRNLMNILDEKVLSQNIEESLPQNKATSAKPKEIEQKFSQFLKKIKERALDYQNRV